jgi:putative hydrolase of the HAD superfamily
MNATRIELLLLDVHGVLLTRAMPALLRRLARKTGQDLEALERYWRQELRGPAWRGEIDDHELWRRLTDGREPDPDGRAMLERLCRRGPAAELLPAWSARVPVWLLSNHRSHWLEPRLERFGIARHVDRVLVSDATGAVKPEPAAFAPALAQVGDPRRVLFVDDQASNVEAARRLGVPAVHAKGTGWMRGVDARLPAPAAPSRVSFNRSRD